MPANPNLRGIRLIIPHKDKVDPVSNKANLDYLERWANSQVVNQLVAGDGVTITNQPISSGTGNAGTGVVTIAASAGGLIDSHITATVDPTELPGTITTPGFSPSWILQNSTGSDIAIEASPDNANIKILTTGIYEIMLLGDIDFSQSGTPPQTGLILSAINTVNAAAANSDLYDLLFTQVVYGQQFYYIPVGETYARTAIYSTVVFYLVAGDIFSTSFLASPNANGTVVMNSAPPSEYSGFLLVRRIV